MRKPPSASPPSSGDSAERRQTPGRRAVDVMDSDYRDLVDNAVQGILIHANFRPLYANAACAKLFGYDNTAELLALPLIRPLIPPDLWARTEQHYDELMRGQTLPSILRTKALRRDGTEIWLSVAERVVAWRGAPAVQLCAYDISERMRIEQSVVDSEHRLRAMLEILPVPIYIARRRDGQLLFVNRKTCLLLQQSAGPLLKGRSTDFFMEPQDRENLRLLLDAVRDIREVEVQMRTARGREFTAELAAILMDYGGEQAVLVALNDVSQRKRLEAELFQQANTDALTGIHNRRSFMTHAEQEMRRAIRFGRPLAVMMVDLDHFKPINDRLGHAVGDAVLEGVVKKGLESLRQSDIMGRLGGEEFAVLLPETPLVAAVEVADRFRQHIAAHPVVTAKAAVACTVSVGVAEMTPEDPSIDPILHRADEAMYRAKEGGRNRVEKAP